MTAHRVTLRYQLLAFLGDQGPSPFAVLAAAWPDRRGKRSVVSASLNNAAHAGLCTHDPDLACWVLTPAGVAYLDACEREWGDSAPTLGAAAE